MIHVVAGTLQESQRLITCLSMVLSITTVSDFAMAKKKRKEIQTDKFYCESDVPLRTRSVVSP